MKQVKLKCGRCKQIKTVDNFYRVNDKRGYTYRCKKCDKKNSKEQYRKYTDRMLQVQKKYHSTEIAKERRREANMRSRKKFVEKYLARRKLTYAVLSGKIKKEPCKFTSKECHGKIQSHHPDYSKPLDVVWVCLFHHKVLEGKSITLSDIGI